MNKSIKLREELFILLTRIISESNAIDFMATLELLAGSHYLEDKPQIKKLVEEFRGLLFSFGQGTVDVRKLLSHPVALGLYDFFKKFPLPYVEEHIHLTGSLTAEFIYPRLKALLEGEYKEVYEGKIKAVYGEDALPINSVEDVEKLIRLKDSAAFDRYLEILLIPKLILIDKKVHEEAAYHLASELFTKYNVGYIRLKFTLSRDTGNEYEQIPGRETLSMEDVILGLYQGFNKFKQENPVFNFTLSPCFRKEAEHFNSKKYPTKRDHFLQQVDFIIDLIDKHPELAGCMNEVDTVGNERELYRKEHFWELSKGLRKLQYHGFRIRSHHGETWHTLKQGIQAVDNSMNIWQIDTLEHGISLGINPNFFFHSLFQNVVRKNQKGTPIKKDSLEYRELADMDWNSNQEILDKLIKGVPLNDEEVTAFVKTKFHTAREVEAYQHDILNRMIDKQVSLTSLPSSNKRLTSFFPNFKDHPFSWWEKKGVRLGVGTDNYITLRTNFIQEMLIILFSDPQNLKIMKLLMVTTNETKRPYLSQLLWKMRLEALQLEG